MTVDGWVIASAAVGLAAAVQGVVGFGLVLIAAPIVTMVDPGMVPGPMLVAALVLTIVMTVHDRAGVDARAVAWAFVGRIPGSVIGAWLLAQLDADTLELVVAGTVLAGVVMTATRLRILITPRSLLVGGFVAGVMGTTTAIGGPPMAILYQREAGPRLRGTLSSFFVAGTLLSMATLALVGHFGYHEVRLGTALVPGTLAGYAAGRPLARVADEGYLRVAVLGVSTAAAAILLLRRAV